MSSTLATPDGAQLFYHDIARCGSRARPLVMLHGNRGSHRSFDKYAAELSRDYRLVLLDSRGHGESTGGSRGLTLRQLADDVALVLDHLGLADVAVLGFSDGANVALTLGATGNRRVNAIIAVSPNTHSHGLRWWLRLALVAQVRLAALAVKIGLPVKTSLELTKLMLDDDTLAPQVLRRISVPVLVLTGPRDIILPHHSNAIAAAIPDARVQFVHRAGHFAMFARRAEYLELIRGFLQ